MTHLQLDKQTAIKLYPEAAPEFKAMLEETFGKETFVVKITDRLKSLKDCLDYLGVDSRKYSPLFCFYPPGSRKAVLQGFEGAIIAIEAINEGWIPDIDNPKEKKWEIWWDMRNGDLVFGHVIGWSYGSCVGSRRCFRDPERAKWAAQQPWFVEICKKFMVIKQL